MEEKSSLYIVAIVGVVAIVALIMLVIEAGNRSNMVYSSSEDSSGQVFRVASIQTACEKHCGEAGVYQENPCMCKNPIA